MTSKIGQNTRLKQAEDKPYTVIGIAKTDEGYEVRRLTISGLEVKNVKAMHKSANRAEAMQMLQIMLGDYIIKFNQGETK